MKIVLGCDHGGYVTKEELKKDLLNKGYEVVDVGTNSTNSCNYAEFALKAATLVGNGDVDFGVLICNSGEGVSIAANKVKNVRCGIGYNDEVAGLLRSHNDANMIAFGAHFATVEEIINRTNIFLNTNFLGERHAVRVQTIKDFEKK